jgi:hypothetical protein
MAGLHLQAGNEDPGPGVGGIKLGGAAVGGERLLRAGRQGEGAQLAVGLGCFLAAAPGGGAGVGCRPGAELGDLAQDRLRTGAVALGGAA